MNSTVRVFSIPAYDTIYLSYFLKTNSTELWGLSTDGTFLRSNHNRLLQVSKGKHVAEVLLSELEMVSKTAEKERNRLDKITLRKERQRRLLYLFQKDLLPGVSGQILHSKVHREDLQVHGAASFEAKVFVYLLILSLNAAMLFYVFLFALGQTKYRQDAWFRSFMIWISMEIFVVGTVIVLITHVILPSLIMPDVAKIKDKLVDSIREYQRDLKNKAAEEKADAEEKTFNSAEFFFASSKLAKFYMDLPVAQIISKFSTPWPRQSYQHVVDVSHRYDRRFSGLSSSVGIILFFFIGNFLIAPPGVQDGMLHSLFTVAVGYLVLLHIQLYNVQPALAFIPLFTICVLVHFIVLSFRKRPQSKIADVAPIMEGRNRNNYINNSNSSKINHLSRRDSILAGLNTVVAAQNHLVEPGYSSGSCSISIGSISIDSSGGESLTDKSSVGFNPQCNEHANEIAVAANDSDSDGSSEMYDSPIISRVGSLSINESKHVSGSDPISIGSISVDSSGGESLSNKSSMGFNPQRMNEIAAVAANDSDSDDSSEMYDSPTISRASSRSIYELKHANSSDPPSFGSMSVDSAEYQFLSDSSEESSILGPCNKIMIEKAEEDNLDICDS
jgi:hypothetical protein